MVLNEEMKPCADELPRVSVIIPAYQAEKSLRRCLASVCAQQGAELEIWVVDDGSRDGTWAVLQELAAADPRIHGIHQENQGVSAARNAALDRCTGDFVRFVDADDELPEDAIAPLAQRMLRDQSDLLIGGFIEKVAMIQHRRNLANRGDTLDKNDYLTFWAKNANSFFCGVLWNKLFRRDLIERQQLRFESGLTYGEDFLFVCRYLQGAQRISFVQEAVYHYIRNPSSMTYRQVADSVLHPVRNMKIKGRLYRGLCELFRSHNAYEQHRFQLWLYWLRLTLTE